MKLYIILLNLLHVLIVMSRNIFVCIIAFFIHSIMSSANLKGFSNLVSGTSKSAPTSPAWLKRKDVIHSTQSELPQIDLSSADLNSQQQAVTNQSKRIVQQAKRKASGSLNSLPKKKKQTHRVIVKPTKNGKNKRGVVKKQKNKKKFNKNRKQRR